MSLELEQALAVVKAAGFRVVKPRAKATVATLNAIGKPYSANYDPNYRVKHKPTTAHLFKPYGKHMRDHLTPWCTQ